MPAPVAAPMMHGPTGPGVERWPEIWNRLRQLAGTPLARGAAWALVGQVASVCFQLATFIILARLLGAEQFGVFAGASALVSVALPFSTLGAGMVFMRHVTKCPAHFHRYWGNILLSAAIVNGPILLGLWLITPALLNSSVAALVIIIALGNCAFGQFIQCVAQIYQTRQQLHIAANWSAATNLLRFVAVVSLMYMGTRMDAWGWAVASTISSFLVAAAACVIVTATHGAPEFDVSVFARHSGEGLLFSLAGSTATIYNDFDKTVLSRCGFNQANGVYTTAYRVIDIACLPVSAVEWAAAPRFFQEGLHGLAAVVRFCNKVLVRTMAVAVLTSAAVFAFAPLLPILFGYEFAAASHVLRWLAILPLFRGVHQITGAALTGAGFQKQRTVAQAAAAVLNIALDLAWIPTMSWVGATRATLISDGVLGVMNWSALIWLLHHRAAVPSVPLALRTEVDL
jgi:O-antigen/teichoic acid export membrane protein